MPIPTHQEAYRLEPTSYPLASSPRWSRWRPRSPPAAAAAASSDRPADGRSTKRPCEGIESGDIDLSLGIDVEGRRRRQHRRQPLRALPERRQRELPELDLSAKANGSVGRQKHRLRRRPRRCSRNKAYVGYEGTEYEVDPTTFSFVKSAVEEAQAKAAPKAVEPKRDRLPGSGRQAQGRRLRRKPQQRRQRRRRRHRARPRSAATSTSPARARRGHRTDRRPGLQRAARRRRPAALDAELDEAKGESKDSVKYAHVDVYVGDDDIVRRISAAADDRTARRRPAAPKASISIST